MTAPASVEAGVVHIDAGPLALQELVRIARGATVEITPAARARIEASRSVVDAAVLGDRLIYGLNSGLGHMRDQRMPPETLAAYQEAIVASHTGTLGAPLPTEVVRAAMAVRVNGIARGGSGASPAVADALVAMLNARIHPVVGAVGSVGAADLMHMAAIAQVARGYGRAEVAGRIVDGAEALRSAGLEPLRLGPKDGLAMISANGVSIGHGALVVERGRVLAEVADVSVALGLEAVAGNPSIVSEVAARAKPVGGQIEAARRIRLLLEGSTLCVDGGPTSIQDPLSFRVVPQVHGALRTFLDFAADAVELELNAIDDNPMVSIEDGELVSNGNFHPMVLALAIDALRPALAHVGQLADRRLDHHWRVLFAEPMTIELMERLSGAGVLLRYAAAARAGDLRSLAAPATLDLGPLDLGVEDHATNAATAVARTDAALDALLDVLAVEVLSSRSVFDGQDRSGLGRGTAAVLAALDEAVALVPATAPVEDRHAAVAAALVGPIREIAANVIAAAR